MANNSFVYIVMFLLLVGIGVILYKKTTTKSKPARLKKEEIIKKYEYEMLKVISKYEKDNKILTQKKIEFLKEASKELHQNIFFDEKEVKVLISKLASL